MLLFLFDLCFSSQIPLDGPLCLFLSCSLILSFLHFTLFVSFLVLIYGVLREALYNSAVGR